MKKYYLSPQAALLTSACRPHQSSTHLLPGTAPRQSSQGVAQQHDLVERALRSEHTAGGGGHVLAHGALSVRPGHHCRLHGAHCGQPTSALDEGHHTPPERHKLFANANKAWGITGCSSPSFFHGESYAAALNSALPRGGNHTVFLPDACLFGKFTICQTKTFCIMQN